MPSRSADYRRKSAILDGRQDYFDDFDGLSPVGCSDEGDKHDG